MADDGSRDRGSDHAAIRRLADELLPARMARAGGGGEPGESSRRGVTSPAVGTFHPQAGASLGRAVRAGDVVGHVEVLGVPQEVLAPFDGILGRLLLGAGP